MNNKLDIGFASFVIHDGKVLITLRDNKPGIQTPGKYALVCGGYESKDLFPLRTAMREIQEELCLNIPAHRIVFLGREWIYSLNKLSYIYALTLCDREAESICLKEGQSYTFASCEEAHCLNQQGQLGGFLHRSFVHEPGYARLVITNRIQQPMHIYRQ